MGYILPIKHDQYVDYQKRVIVEKRDPYFITQPFRAVLETQYEEMKDRTKHHFHQDQIGSNSKNKQSEKIYAAITGKGTRFSEQI